MQHKDLIIVWFRNDLRLRDNEALFQAVQDADHILPVYIIDPRFIDKTNTSFGFNKMGKFRAKFLLESLQDLKYGLQDLGADLMVNIGKPEALLFALARFYKAKAIYCHQEATSEEFAIEDALDDNLHTIGTRLELFWGATLYHYDDLPFNVENLPNIFTDFRKKVEKKATIRSTFPIPNAVSTPPDVNFATIPSLKALGFDDFVPHNKAVLPFKGGEVTGLQRLKHYFWKSNALETYKETRNGLLGADYSSKFSPWLAHGCLSPRTIYEEVQAYEKERVKNKSTYWMIFELLWRDYFRFVAMCHGNDLFKLSGLKGAKATGKSDWKALNAWKMGQTGIPFIDANMRELLWTGFMSNRGRQNVASFLVKDMGVDWRLGAAYFEQQLIDYDPCSNYGNWNYVAGVGNDPRENRYFNVLSQAKRYDPNGWYVKHWCPELKKVPSSLIHEPYRLTLDQQRYLGLQIGLHYPKPCINLRTWKALQRKKHK